MLMQKATLIYGLVVRLMANEDITVPFLEKIKQIFVIH